MGLGATDDDHGHTSGNDGRATELRRYTCESDGRQNDRGKVVTARDHPCFRREKDERQGDDDEADREPVDLATEERRGEQQHSRDRNHHGEA